MDILSSYRKAHIQQLFAGLFLFAVVVVAYIPAMSGGFVWDDDLHITDNQLLRSAEGLKKIWFEPGAWPHYYPLVLTSFWIQYQLWGLEPFGYHLTNILIHALSSILLWRILRKLNIPGAWVAACLFALHPVHVESVAWASENKNILSGFFYLSSLLVYVHLAFQNMKEKQFKLFYSRKDTTLYFFSLFLFLLALFAKTVTCSLPAVIVLLLWWKRDRITWDDLLPLLPFFVFGLILGLSTVWTELFNVGSMGKSTWDLTYLDRLLIAGRSLWFYAGKLILPYNVTFEYPRWDINASQWWQFLFPISFLTVLSLLWCYRKKIGKGPLTAVLIFSGTLLPALGFFNLYTMRYSYVADHFQYLASIALITLFSAIIVRSINHYAGKNVRTMMMVFFGLFIILFGCIDWHESKKFKDLETLWRDTISKNPNAVMAHANLGNVLNRQGKPKEAIQYYSKAIQLRPDWHEPYINLGSALINCGRLSEAIQHFEIALKLEPDSVQIYYNMGIIAGKQGKTDQAIVHFLQVIELAPDFLDAHIIIAQLYESKGEIETAKKHYSLVLQKHPNSKRAQNGLSILEKKEKEFHTARAVIQKKLETDPENPSLYYAMGETYQKIGKLHEAISYYQKAVSIEKVFFPALNKLAQIYSIIGKNDEAITLYKEIVKHKPALSATIYYNIACLYSRQQEATRSIHYLKKAVEQGFNKRALIEQDPDLAYIRTLPEYKTIVTTIQ